MGQIGPLNYFFQRSQSVLGQVDLGIAEDWVAHIRQDSSSIVVRRVVQIEDTGPRLVPDEVALQRKEDTVGWAKCDHAHTKRNALSRSQDTVRYLQKN